jgi:hypothetical protein
MGGIDPRSFLQSPPHAVAAKQKGDVHGRIDHESLGSGLHQVGLCLSSIGEFAAARPWYERAVAEAEKGDVHGRVDHESVALTIRAIQGLVKSTDASHPLWLGNGDRWRYGCGQGSK